MGGNSKTTNTSSRTVYGNTTTTNPYATAKTDNLGTQANFAPGSALESVYNFVNDNINSMLDEYLNPNLNSQTNQAKIKAYQNTLNSAAASNLENNIINPLSKRNMIRSSQATDLYKNLSNTQSASLDNYINDLLSTAQNDSASMLNNLLKMYLQGYNVLSDMSTKSLNTSAGNASKYSNTTIDGGNNEILEQVLPILLKAVQNGTV